MDEQGLLSAIEELMNSPVVTGFPCSVGEFLKKLSDESKEKFNKLLDTPKYGVASIHNIVINKGYEVSKASLYKHCLLYTSDAADE